jgi:stage V sporulation protein D (sporulation-specific penicillin-binding protein)
MGEDVNLQIDAYGEGDVVVRQSPDPGTRVKEGSKIKLYFGKKDN